MYSSLVHNIIDDCNEHESYIADQQVSLTLLHMLTVSKLCITCTLILTLILYLTKFKLQI